MEGANTLRVFSIGQYIPEKYKENRKGFMDLTLKTHLQWLYLEMNQKIPVFFLPSPAPQPDTSRRLWPSVPSSFEPLNLQETHQSFLFKVPTSFGMPSPMLKMPLLSSSLHHAEVSKPDVLLSHSVSFPYVLNKILFQWEVLNLVHHYALSIRKRHDTHIPGQILIFAFNVVACCPLQSFLFVVISTKKHTPCCLQAEFEQSAIVTVPFVFDEHVVHCGAYLHDLLACFLAPVITKARENVPTGN